MSDLATSDQNLKRFNAPIMIVATDQVPESSVTVQTRFGLIEFDRSSILTFPKGIPGFKDYQEFGLSKLPGASEVSNLVLLQSIEPTDLSLIVCSYEPAAGLIDAEDLAEACEHLSIRMEDCAIALIANFHREGDSVRISVNVRAPVLIDSANRLAWQYILSNDKYSVRHMLAE